MTTILLDAVARLETALNTLAAALAAGDSGAVLRAEEPIASALHALAACPARDSTDASGLGPAILAVRAAMRRCEALGASASQFSRVALRDASYGRRGLQVIPALTRRVTSVT
jgi:hypothetical protein